MSKSAFYDSTRKRLNQYNVFNDDTLDFVATLAQKQVEFESYPKFFKATGVPLEPTLFMNSRGRGVVLIDISSREEKERGVFVIHLPMGNSLDTNQLYQVATVALAFPTYRIIAFGNPSGKPYAHPEQNFSVKDWWKVAFSKDVRAAVSTELDYLASQNIKSAIHIGYSYGALKALVTASYADPASIQQLVLLDPVAHPRGPRQLLGDFNATFASLGEYVNRTELQTFLDARQDAVRRVEYTKGIMRPVNLAIGFMLARADFIPLLERVLQKHPTLKVYVAWGSKSELGNDAHMKASLHNLAHDIAKGRVRSLRLEGDTHAFANDLHVYAAIVHDALSS